MLYVIIIVLYRLCKHLNRNIIVHSFISSSIKGVHSVYFACQITCHSQRKIVSRPAGF